MIAHPMIMIPKLVVLAIIAVALIVLHGILTPAQFVIAVVASAILFLVASIAIWVATAKLLADPDSEISKATVLSHAAKTEDGFKASPDQFASLVGQHGVAVSSLNPAGTALIEQRRVPVMTDGEFVEADAPVVVVRASGAKVVVREAKADVTS